MSSRNPNPGSPIFKEGDKIFILKTDLLDIFTENFIGRLSKLLITLNNHPESVGIRVILYIPIFYNIRKNNFKEENDNSIVQENKCIHLFNDDIQDLLFIDLKVEDGESMTIDDFLYTVTELIKEAVYVN